VWLEVIEQNDAAFRLYEKLGYDLVRWVEVWTLSAELPPGSRTRGSSEQAHARIRELRTRVSRGSAPTRTSRHYGDARGARDRRRRGDLPARRRGAGVQIAVSRRELLQAVRSHGNVVMLNLPAGDPVGDAMRELGGSVTVRQREMVPASRKPGLDSEAPMALRICLVTPFAWSQPHEVNEHVAGVARSCASSGTR
jgi:hypothetical protein